MTTVSTATNPKFAMMSERRPRTRPRRMYTVLARISGMANRMYTRPRSAASKRSRNNAREGVRTKKRALPIRNENANSLPARLFSSGWTLRNRSRLFIAVLIEP